MFLDWLFFLGKISFLEFHLVCKLSFVPGMVVSLCISVCGVGGVEWKEEEGTENSTLM